MLMTPGRLASIPANYSEKRRQFIAHLLVIKKSGPRPIEETYFIVDENKDRLVFGQDRIVWKK